MSKINTDHNPEIIASRTPINNPSIPSDLLINTYHEIDNLKADLEAGINKVAAESQELRNGTNKLMTQVYDLHVRADELKVQSDNVRTQTDNVRTQTDDLKARTDALQKQIDDLMLTREFSIDLSECFLAHPQFTNSETGKLISKYRLPIRAYCPSIYWGRPITGGKFLREIHIKISEDNLSEYPTQYDFADANDILRCVIQGYKQEKRMRIIAKDHTDDEEYWYFQFQVADNQECIDLAKLIVSKWLQIVYKQPVADIPTDN